MDVRHAQPADARGLIGERLLVGVQPEIDDVFDAERLDIGELLFGRLTGGRDPLVEPAPVVNVFGVGHREEHPWLTGELSQHRPRIDAGMSILPASRPAWNAGPMRDLVAPAGAGIVYTLA